MSQGRGRFRGGMGRTRHRHCGNLILAGVIGRVCLRASSTFTGPDPPKNPPLNDYGVDWMDKHDTTTPAK
jgi:hypothetical protein